MDIQVFEETKVFLKDGLDETMSVVLKETDETKEEGILKFWKLIFLEKKHESLGEEKKKIKFVTKVNDSLYFLINAFVTGVKEGIEKPKILANKANFYAKVKKYFLLKFRKGGVIHCQQKRNTINRNMN